jgi:hypothetical protein
MIKWRQNKGKCKWIQSIAGKKAPKGDTMVPKQKAISDCKCIQSIANKKAPKVDTIIKERLEIIDELMNR